MKKIHSILLMILSFWFLLFSAPASAVIDPAAAVVLVRVSCTNNGNLLNDCFENLWTLNSWITATRHPNANSPLKVDIGPGTFGPNVANDAVGTRFKCNPASNFTGYISFEGAGSDQTIITGSGNGTSSPLMVVSCTKMNFSHLQITTTGYGAVQWSGGGVSHWNDVQLIGIGRAWYEIDCSTTPGTHYWTSSQLTATSAFTVADTYDASCDESFFFGSQINLIGAGLGNINGTVVADGAGIIHLYGSHIRAINAGSAPAVNAYSGGMIHIHGTGIDVTSTIGQNIVALMAASGGMIHANSSAFMMSSTGTMTRISNNGGAIMAPYLWQEGASPPNVISANGSDQAVITATSDGHPHLLIYGNTCSSSWYDINLHACH